MAGTTRARARDNLVAAAFELFAERGFQATTIDDIAKRADVGRTTFFRIFGTKEAVIFPEHASMLALIDERLTMTEASPDARALAEAAAMVLAHYLREGEFAKLRYRLVDEVPALRARETTGTYEYQRLFASHAARWLSGEPDSLLRAEVIAAEVVGAHNHVLRSWLRGDSASPETDLNDALRMVFERFSRPTELETTIVVMRTAATIEAVSTQLGPLLTTPS